MITVEQLLMTAKEQGASDVHITVGVPPKMRVNGELLDLDYPRLMPDDCEKIVLSIMNERQLAMFKEMVSWIFIFNTTGRTLQSKCIQTERLCSMCNAYCRY